MIIPRGITRTSIPSADVAVALIPDANVSKMTVYTITNPAQLSTSGAAGADNAATATEPLDANAYFTVEGKLTLFIQTAIAPTTLIVIGE